MTDKEKVKAGKTEYTDANAAAQTMTRDPGVKAQTGSKGGKGTPETGKGGYSLDPPGETGMPTVRRIHAARRIPRSV